MNKEAEHLGFMPITLSKSIDENGAEILKMNGVMSTTSKDADGQHLNPSGFDMSEFMSDGFMNWHHQSNKNPLAIIGRPTGFNLDKGKNEMHVDFELFPNNPMAQQVYQLQEVLEGQGLSLGLSLEGDATEFRDPLTKTYVEKAKITGCAVTPSAKNKDAIVGIVKGNIDSYQLIKGDILSEGNGSQIGEERHPLAKESLETTTKKEIEEEEEGKDQEELIKSEVFKVTRRRFPSISLQTLEKFYTFTLELEKSKKIQHIMKKSQETGVSKSTLEKALTDLDNMSKGIDVKESEKIQKAKESNPIEGRIDRMEKGMATIIGLLKSRSEPTLKKAEGEEKEEEEEEGEGEEGEGEEGKLEKAEEGTEEGEGEEGEEKGEGEGEGEGEKMEKGKRVEKISLNPSNEVSSLIKGLGDTITIEVGGLRKEMTELKKANEVLTKGLRKANSKIEGIGKESQGRKTITTSKFLRKGDSEEEANLNILSKVSDKRFICDTLMKGAMEGNRVTDQKLANAIIQFEQSNIATNTLVKGLRTQGYTLEA